MCLEPIKPGTKDPNACTKCGTLKKNGKLTCCAPGGSWFDKCGSGGDSKEHTWFEGIEACVDFVPGNPPILFSASQRFLGFFRLAK